FVVAGEFEIQLHGDCLTEQVEIALLDVAAILAEVERNAVGTSQLGERGRPDRVGFVRHAGLTHRGHVVDVYPQDGHVGGCSRAACNDCARLTVNPDTDIQAGFTLGPTARQPQANSQLTSYPDGR